MAPVAISQSYFERLAEYIDMVRRLRKHACGELKVMQDRIRLLFDYLPKGLYGRLGPH
jgi:hypothetical protein